MTHSVVCDTNVSKHAFETIVSVNHFSVLIVSKTTIASGELSLHHKKTPVLSGLCMCYYYRLRNSLSNIRIELFVSA